MAAEIEMLHDRMRDALCEKGFIDLFGLVPDDRKEAVVEEQLARRGVPITIISIKRAPNGSPGDYLVNWRPAGTEENHRWWFPETKTEAD